MKRTVLFLSLLLAVSCTGPGGYLKKAVFLMDRGGFFADGPEWEAEKDRALSARPSTMEESYEVVRKALKVAGGKHSFIYPASIVQEDETAEWTMPVVSITEDRIAQISIPEFSGNREQSLQYAQTVLQGVPDDIKGAVIDLRGNAGGNMYPMIASLQRFISNGDDMLTFRGRKRDSKVSLSFVLLSVGVDSMSRLDCPVAILTDGETASSGEATLICFRGQDNTRTFGSPTAGYASANSSFKMPDGSRLVLTTGCDVSRTGEVFCDDPIAPDCPSETPLEDALAWIRSF